MPPARDVVRRRRGDSAGQAAIFLAARRGSRVPADAIRRERLAAQHVALPHRRGRRRPAHQVAPPAPRSSLGGRDHLVERVTRRAHHRLGEHRRSPAASCFCFIGAIRHRVARPTRWARLPSGLRPRSIGSSRNVASAPRFAGGVHCRSRPRCPGAHSRRPAPRFAQASPPRSGKIGRRCAPSTIPWPRRAAHAHAPRPSLERRSMYLGPNPRVRRPEQRYLGARQMVRLRGSCRPRRTRRPPARPGIVPRGSTRLTASSDGHRSFNQNERWANSGQAACATTPTKHESLTSGEAAKRTLILQLCTRSC